TPGQDATRWPRVGKYQLNWHVLGNPLGAVQRSGGRTSDGRGAFSPQPCGRDALLKRRLVARGQIDVGQQGPVSSAQLMAVHRSTVQRLAADEWFLHAGQIGTTAALAYSSIHRQFQAKRPVGRPCLR